MNKKNKLADTLPPHDHKMVRKGMTMYCKCGYHFDILCSHTWKIDSRQSISIEKMGGKITQSREIRICTECGSIANMNTTTGVTHITR